MDSAKLTQYLETIVGENIARPMSNDIVKMVIDYQNFVDQKFAKDLGQKFDKYPFLIAKELRISDSVGQKRRTTLMLVVPIDKEVVRKALQTVTKRRGKK